MRGAKNYKNYGFQTINFFFLVVFWGKHNIFFQMIYLMISSSHKKKLFFSPFQFLFFKYSSREEKQKKKFYVFFIYLSIIFLLSYFFVYESFMIEWLHDGDSKENSNLKIHKKIRWESFRNLKWSRAKKKCNHKIWFCWFLLPFA